MSGRTLIPSVATTPSIINVERKIMEKKQQWLSVLTDEQRDMRRQKRYDEINLTDEQKLQLGEEGCCWIESPTFYSVSKWCS